ncbi:unnamed protein product, partial [Closterium sp. NIES-54]
SGAAGAGGARAGSARGTRATGAGGARAGGAGGARAGGAGGIGAAGAGGSGAAGAGATGPAGAGGVGGSGAGGTRAYCDYNSAGGVGAGGAGGAGAADVIATVIATAPPSPYPAQTGSLAEHHELESRPASPICTLNRARRSRPPPCIAPPSPPASSVSDIPDPESNLARDASPTVTRLLATIVTGPSLESTSAFSLVIELVNFVATRRLDYVASLVTESESVCPPSVGDELALGCDVLEDRQFELECLAAVLPHFASMVLCPEGDLDAMDIPTPRSYAEAIIGEYSPQWQTSIDEEMAS